MRAPRRAQVRKEVRWARLVPVQPDAERPLADPHRLRRARPPTVGWVGLAAPVLLEHPQARAAAHGDHQEEPTTDRSGPQRPGPTEAQFPLRADQEESPA